jgi:hypothetical protein
MCRCILFSYWCPVLHLFLKNFEYRYKTLLSLLERCKIFQIKSADEAERVKYGVLTMLSFGCEYWFVAQNKQIIETNMIVISVKIFGILLCYFCPSQFAYFGVLCIGADQWSHPLSSISYGLVLFKGVRLPLQPTTPHWETPSMADRAIPLSVCHRRTAQGLPDWIQTMFGRAVFIQLLA